MDNIFSTKGYIWEIGFSDPGGTYVLNLSSGPTPSWDLNTYWNIYIFIFRIVPLYFQKNEYQMVL